jgi:predicted kinase
VILMCGLPASGKTTTAARLHAALGGLLIRSCDVYRDLGISLPDWVRRTRGFTERVEEYARLRDAAYVEMAGRLRAGLAEGASPIVVDAVHGERDKRAGVYAVCRAHGASPVLVWCRCDDELERARRIRARLGREHEPEHEAADVSVLRHLVGLWQDPASDGVPLVAYDTMSPRVVARTGPESALVDLVASALAAAPESRARVVEAS